MPEIETVTITEAEVVATAAVFRDFYCSWLNAVVSDSMGQPRDYNGWAVRALMAARTAASQEASDA